MTKNEERNQEKEEVMDSDFLNEVINNAFYIVKKVLANDMLERDICTEEVLEELDELIQVWFEMQFNGEDYMDAVRDKYSYLFEQ